MFGDGYSKGVLKGMSAVAGVVDGGDKKGNTSGVGARGGGGGGRNGATVVKYSSSTSGSSRTTT